MDIRVKPLSRKEIINLAHKLRYEYNPNEILRILKLIEDTYFDPELRLDYEILEDDDIELEGVLAKYLPFQNKILIRESVYINAALNTARDRFTLAHEYGHFVLHDIGSLSFARSSNTIKAYENPEWQANEFAANLLLPLNMINEDDATEYLAKKFKVSKQVAEIQLAKKRKLKL